MGKLGGEYSKYNEISVKRVMTRDGQSNYFINKAKVRRKDVQDIFLGTGLGPNSYAIIEQGMVSKIVSARPEDLRISTGQISTKRPFDIFESGQFFWGGGIAQYIFF